MTKGGPAACRAAQKDWAERMLFDNSGTFGGPARESESNAITLQRARQARYRRVLHWTNRQRQRATRRQRAPGRRGRAHVRASSFARAASRLQPGPDPENSPSRHLPRRPHPFTGRLASAFACRATRLGCRLGSRRTPRVLQAVNSLFRPLPPCRSDGPPRRAGRRVPRLKSSSRVFVLRKSVHTNGQYSGALRAQMMFVCA